MNKLLVALPALLFGVFAALAYAGMQRDTTQVDTAFAGRPAPALTVEPLTEDHDLLTAAMLRAPELKLVNFWAAWCGPCREEHPELMDLAAAGIPVYGVNYKDPNGAAFLARLGNPFRAIGADPTGRTGLDWGVRALPETFLVDADGTVIERITGEVTGDHVIQILDRASRTAAPG